MVIELWFGDFSWWFDWNLIGFHRDFIGIFYGIFYVLNSWGIPWRHHGFFKTQIIQWSDWMIWDTPMTSDTYIYGNILYTWWLIPRLVFVGHNPSYFSGLTRSLSHVNHWGYNPRPRAVGSSPPSSYIPTIVDNIVINPSYITIVMTFNSPCSDISSYIGDIPSLTHHY